MDLPPGTTALNTKAWPSGASANEGTLTVVLIATEKTAFSGGKTWKLIGSSADVLVEFTEGRAAWNSATPRNRTAATQPVHWRRLWPTVEATTAESDGLLSASSI